MNSAQIKLTLVFLVFAVIGFGPVSPGCLVGLFVLVRRPMWFHRLIEELYQGQPRGERVLPGRSVRLQAGLVLATLFVIDILPYPVTPSIVLPLIVIRPLWLHQIIQAIYDDPSPGKKD